ncbi:MAG: hypothetical protein ACLQMF_19930, partial [Rectinemataceae bacterium]
ADDLLHFPGPLNAKNVAIKLFQGFATHNRILPNTSTRIPEAPYPIMYILFCGKIHFMAQTSKN